MAVIDLTLDSFKVPDIDGYTPPFGTKITRTEANKGGLSTVEVNSNVMMPFANMRPKVVTEDSSTTAVEYDAKLCFSASLTSGATLTLGNGDYEGCELCIYNCSMFDCTLSKGNWTVVLGGGVPVSLVWSGTEWVVNDGSAIGDIMPSSLLNIKPGWMECNGQAVSRSIYARLFHEFSTQTYDDDPTHTLLSRYGEGDGTTFNLPDLRECALVGAGQSTRAILDSNGHAHDVYAVGEFKDDQFQGHIHSIQNGYDGSDENSAERGNAVHGYSAHSTEPQTLTNYGTPRIGSTTHGKQVGVTYFIKVL